MILRLLIIFIPVLLVAQNESANQFEPVSPPARVHMIVITGNKITKDEVIHHYIDMELNTIITAEELEDVKNRVLSIDLFKKVDVLIEAVNGDTILFVDVKENIYLFPFPFAQLVDQDWSKINIGVGVANSNLFGLNQKLFMTGWLGFNPGFNIYYENPWAGKSGWSYGGTILNTVLPNRIFPFKETHFGGSVFVGKNLSVFTKVNLAFNFDHIILPGENSFYPGKRTYEDDNMKLSAAITVDHRNNKFFPVKGYFANLSYYYAFWSQQEETYKNMSLDLRYFHQLGQHSTIGFRTLGVKRSDKQPVNDFLLFGFSYRIRGYFNQISQGSWLNISTVSYRFPLLPIKYYDLKAPFLLSDEDTKSLPFGISLALFIETGFLVDQIKKLTLPEFDTGFGAGILFHLPYVHVARFDLAVNEKLDNFDFIFLLRVAF